MATDKTILLKYTDQTERVLMKKSIKDTFKDQTPPKKATTSKTVAK